ncbi:ribosomal protein S5 domain 2-like protein [Neolentinus lepideus HHB14362 ss-1]|uniref:Ribosomal protein S5 domain 2-like protein n=1 Tax=Neolentinus lepideus HHB14362 ss-1 TaxID=1314782 RepID=A0A165PSZ4_9AGAM|nr:ribosomal protein S5 domain 2-like protein [Neolentinus lepideus HHB14362 ss-1]
MPPSATTLDSFIISSKAAPQVLATSQEIRDRKSIFVASAYKASSPAEARSVLKHHKHVVHGAKPASHEFAAWRCMMLKDGKTGLDGVDDFEVQSGWEDDGERYGGNKILKVMQTEGVIDVIVIVSRWYGGIMLGPARFEHIETCAREVCRSFKLKQDMEECIVVLTALDDELTKLRKELARLSLTSQSTDSSYRPSEVEQPSQSTENKEQKKSQNYATLSDSRDVAKARRLITARENSIKSLKGIIAKKKTST